MLLTPSQANAFAGNANRTPGGFTGGAYGETTTRIMPYAENVTLRQ
jgi:hypothetical protein